MSSIQLPFKHSVANEIVFPSFIDQQVMDRLKDLHLRPDDLFIVTYPKSGTTWVQQIIKLIKNDGKEDGRTVDEAIPFIEEALCAEAEHHIRDRVGINEMPSPRYFKSHMPYQMMPGGPPHTASAKYIYVARNPKDVAVSLFYHLRGFKKP